MATVEQGLSDVITKSVDLGLLKEPGYRAGVIQGVCRVRAFLNSSQDHTGITQAQITANLKAEKRRFNEEVRQMAANDSALERAANHRPRAVKAVPELDMDANTIPVPDDWAPPEKMPEHLRLHSRQPQAIPAFAVNALACC